jgi:hypothetical protein
MRSFRLSTNASTGGDYEEAKPREALFVCAPGHENIGDGGRRCCWTSGSFVIMEKLGVAGALLRNTTPAPLRSKTPAELARSRSTPGASAQKLGDHDRGGDADEEQGGQEARPR